MTPALVPGSHELAKPLGCKSRRKTSLRVFVSPGTRFVAQLKKATNRPSAEIEGRSVWEFACTPRELALTLSVVPLWRSRTNTSNVPFVSPPGKKATSANGSSAPSEAAAAA